MLKSILAGGCLVVAPLGFAQLTPSKNTSWLDQQIWSRISYSGSRTIGYQSFKFEGDQEAFGSLTNYGTGLQHFTDIGSLSLQGNKVFGILDFKATFADNRFSDPEQQQYTLNYKRGQWDASYGTVQASLLNTNRFANFSRSLTGFVADYKTGRFETKAISSAARGAATTATIPGNNTSGPYYLNSGRIIGGNVKVLLDGVELQQGVDFVIDATLGSITFTNRQIPPTSTIVVSYETFDPTSSGGSIRGAGATYDFGAAGKLGVTMAQQIPPSGASALKAIHDQSPGQFAGVPYSLTDIPIISSIRITVSGIPANFTPTESGGGDFFLLTSPVTVVVSKLNLPPSQIVDIYYNASPVSSVDGNRKVFGIDWTLPIGTPKNGSALTYTKTHGEATGTASASGDAEAVDLRLNEGKGTLKIGFRKVDPGFRSIEQTNFNRNEDAAEYSYEYASRGYSANLGTSNSLITTSESGSLVNSRLTTASFGVRYSDPNRTASQTTRTQSFTVNQSRLDAANQNKLTTMSFRDDFHNKKLSFGYGIDSQTGSGLVNGAMTGIGVNSYRTSLSYDAGKNWAVSGTASKNFVRTDTQTSAGYDYSIRAGMTQTGPWTAGMEYGLGDSGLLSSLTGFLNGGAVGYGGAGFGGFGSSSVINTGSFKTHHASVNATHQAGDALTLSGTYSTIFVQGDSTSNSTINTFLLDSSWRINQAHTLVLDYVNVKSSFLTAGIGSSSSNTFSGYFVGTPGKKWVYKLGYSYLSTTGSQSDETNLALDGELSFRLTPRQRVFVNGTIARTRGLFPQNDRNFQAGYAYTIAPGLALAAKYTFRDLTNLDPSSVSGAFRANGFSIELTLDGSNRH